MEKIGGYKVEIKVAKPKEAEKPVLYVDKEIFRQASLLDLDDDVMHEVHEMYSAVKSNGLTKYKQDDKIVTALIYVVCRKDMIPLTLHKICDVLRIDYRAINKVYRYLLKRMAIHIPPTTPSEYVQKFGIEMQLPKKAIEKAERIIEIARRSGSISGKGPAGVAAASLFMVAELEHIETTPKEIAEISGVTQVTIRNRCKELELQMTGKLKALAAA